MHLFLHFWEFQQQRCINIKSIVVWRKVGNTKLNRKIQRIVCASKYSIMFLRSDSYVYLFLLRHCTKPALYTNARNVQSAICTLHILCHMFILHTSKLLMKWQWKAKRLIHLSVLHFCPREKKSKTISSHFHCPLKFYSSVLWIYSAVSPSLRRRMEWRKKTGIKNTSWPISWYISLKIQRVSSTIKLNFKLFSRFRSSNYPEQILLNSCFFLTFFAC